MKTREQAAGEMRERVRAVLEGESSEARNKAIEVVESLRRGYANSIEYIADPRNDNAIPVVLFFAAEEFNAWIWGYWWAPQCLLDDPQEYTDETLDPSAPRTELWGISVTEDEGYDAMVGYWLEYVEEELIPNLEDQEKRTKP